MRRSAVGLGLAALLGAAAWAFAPFQFVTSSSPADAPVPLGSRSLGPGTIATDLKTSFLVPWVEQSYFFGQEVEVARISLDGGVLDPRGILLDTGGPFSAPESAYDGTDYLVLVVGANGGGAQMTRVSSAGQVVDSSDLANTPATQWSGGALASAPGIALAAFEENASTAGAIRITRYVDGGFLDAPPLALATWSTPEVGPLDCAAVAWDGTEFLVAWIDDITGTPRLDATRVWADGGFLADGGAALVNPIQISGCPSLSCGPSGACFLVWADLTNAGAPTGFWLFDGGTSIGGSLSLPSDAGTGIPHVTVTAAGAEVAWSQNLALVDVMNNVTVQLGVLPGDTNPVVGAAGAELLVATANVTGSLLGAIGTSSALAPLVLHQIWNMEMLPSVACGPSGCLAGWIDDRVGSPNTTNVDVWGVRVSTSGSVESPAAFDLTAGAPILGEFLNPPLLTASGHGFLLSGAATFAGTVAIVMDSDGGWIAPASTLNPGNGSNTFFNVVTAASNGEDYLVVWAQPSTAPGVYAARVLADGSSPDRPGILLASPANYPTVASDGTDYLAAWVGTDADGGSVVNVAVVAADGGVAPVNTVVQDGAAFLYGTGMTFSQGEYLLTWTDGDGGVAMWLGDAGVPVTPQIRLPSPFAPPFPSSVPAPYGAFVLVQFPYDAGGAMGGTGLTLQGDVTDPTLVPLPSMIGPFVGQSGLPALAATDGGLLVGLVNDDPIHDALRVDLSVVALNAPLGAACGYGASCASGVCSFGVCCAIVGGCAPDGGADAGAPDAGAGQDAGGPAADGGQRSSLAVGCGCTGSPQGAMLGAALLAWLFAGVRRRRFAAAHAPSKPAARASTGAISVTPK